MPLGESFQISVVFIGGMTVERAAELLRVAPPIAPLHSYRLVDMQGATLALYAELAAL